MPPPPPVAITPTPRPTLPPSTVGKPVLPPAIPDPHESNPWKPTVPPRHWQYIVLHHTASTYATVESINEAHLKRGWEGIGYHFVIGNGNGIPDGTIEPTFRWTQQRHGAHTGGKGVDPIYNQAGIGIVLVGNFDETRPTAAQVASASRLVRTLQTAYHLQRDHIIGHRDAKSTECPGKHFPMSEIVP